MQEEDIKMDFISEEYDFFDINSLPTDIMQNISNQFRRSYSGSEQSPKIITLQKNESIDFTDRLGLDTILDKLLTSLLSAKIELMEIREVQIKTDMQAVNIFIDLFRKETEKYLKTLLLREAQIGSLIFVLDHREDSDFAERYMEQYGGLHKFIIRPENTHRYINYFVLEEACEMQVEFLHEYCDMISLLKLNFVHKKYLKSMDGLNKTANKLKIITSKIATIAQIFPFACNVQKTDLFSCKKTSVRWKRLLGRWIRHKLYGEKEKIRDSFTSLKNGLNIVNATMSIIHRAKDSWYKESKDWGNLVSSTNKILKCVLFQKDAEHEASMLISDPNKHLAKQIWNLPEQKLFKNLISTVLPSIAFCEQLWIPRLFTNFLNSGGCEKLPQLTIEDLKLYNQYIRTFAQHHEKLQMRINSPFMLESKKQIGKTAENSSILGWLNPFKWVKKSKIPMAVIYHIHGGGFISMSSFIHQTYTRIWANDLNVPIISVDYGKAPEYPFPNGLHDCFEGYMWMLYCFRQIYEAEPTQVILVGDSAGGNLVAALTNLLIKLNMRVPDGIVLVYPALNLTMEVYTPSLLTSLNDMILPHTFLKICLEAYVPPDIDSLKDPLVSPITTPEQILSKYPPTRIFVGSKDPFHDDCCRFVEKLNDCKEDIATLMIFDEFPHGFLQFDMKTQPHEECRKATKEVERALQELLNLKK